MKLREHNGKLYLREVKLEDVADQYGTPFYLYDVDFIKERIDLVRRAFRGKIEVFYAVKANPNLDLLRAIRGKVDGLDVSSAGEIEQSLLAGYPPEALSFAGPGKTRDELREAIQRKIGLLSIESLRELRDIASIASSQGMKANVAVRINPDFLVKEFAIKMGGKATQFGVDEEAFGPVADFLRTNTETLNFRGIHVYAGTQCMNEEAIAGNMRHTLDLTERVSSEYGIACRLVNLGGGFGVSYYEEGQDLDVGRIGQLMREPIDRFRDGGPVERRVIIELGRYLVAEAGLYVARIIGEKRSRGETFFVLDGGMNHHLAASGNLGATLRKNYVVKNLSHTGSPPETCNLVGPLCTPLDLMGKSVSVPSPKVGQLIGFLNSGSYAFTASPFLFLGHETPVELLITGNAITEVRRRRKLTDFN